MQLVSESSSHVVWQSVGSLAGEVLAGIQVNKSKEFSRLEDPVAVYGLPEGQAKRPVSTHTDQGR